MAKLGSYYGLCPLIDNKSLLGISEDVTPGCVIVTLGRNMAIKYKLSDQKQIQSWSTKEKLTSPVLYDNKTKKYVAVFNQYHLRLWDETEKNLESVKKLKFPVALHTIIPCEQEPIVVFKDGQILTLSYALEIRKDISTKTVFEKSVVIVNQNCVKVGEKYFVGLLLQCEDVYSYLWVLPDAKAGDNGQISANKIKLERTGAAVNLNGHVTMLTEDGPILFTLWSDARLYTYPLNKEHNSAEPCGSFYAISDSLSHLQPICMLALSETYMAMYGADSNQEGASLQIYNTQFRVTQARTQLKLYTEGLKLWRIGTNILLTVAQNLAVIPFHLATEQLAALVGSHKLGKLIDDDIAIVTEMLVENWVPSEPEYVSDEPLEFSDLLKEGWSETAICEEIFPKLIERKQTESIRKNLDYFTDIPESTLVKLLTYCLERNTNSDDLTITEQNKALLDKILSESYSDIFLQPQLRIGLKFDHALILLQYLSNALNDSNYVLPNLDVTKSEAKLIDWACLVIDSHYQQLLLSKDVKILQSLEYFKALVDSYTLCLEEFKKLEPLVTKLKKRKNTTKLVNILPLKYSIEKLKLY